MEKFQRIVKYKFIDKNESIRIFSDKQLEKIKHACLN